MEREYCYTTWSSHTHTDMQRERERTVQRKFTDWEPKAWSEPFKCGQYNQRSLHCARWVGFFLHPSIGLFNVMACLSNQPTPYCCWEPEQANSQSTILYCSQPAHCPPSDDLPLATPSLVLWLAQGSPCHWQNGTSTACDGQARIALPVSLPHSRFSDLLFRMLIPSAFCGSATSSIFWKLTTIWWFKNSLRFTNYICRHIKK